MAKLTRLQRIVLDLYENGFYKAITDTDQLPAENDALLTFVVLEAGESKSIREMLAYIALAVKGLYTLSRDLYNYHGNKKGAKK
jgi:hypothetical protein